MFALFHLIFETIRVIILAVVYGLLLRFIKTRVFKKNPLKKRYLFPLLFVALLIWRFSYWRDNGLGDFARVPLDETYEVTMIDFHFAAIQNSSSPSNIGLVSGIESLYEQDDFIYAKTSYGFAIFNFETGIIQRKLSEQEFLSKNGDLNKLMSSSEFHQDHWGWCLLFF